jgi:hypothetical protein
MLYLSFSSTALYLGLATKKRFLRPPAGISGGL